VTGGEVSIELTAVPHPAQYGPLKRSGGADHEARHRRPSDAVANGRRPIAPCLELESVSVSEGVMDFKTADLYDSHGESLRVCEPIFRDFGGRVRFCGPIVTVKCFEDNSFVKSTLAEPGEGRVLVVDAGGSLRCAMLGDLIAASAVEQGWAGVILFGCVRDSAEIAEMPLGVKALATNPRKSQRRGEGQRDIPVTFAGVRFASGDQVYCDEDGILVAEQSLLG